jgi:hypothetical protein
LSAAIVGAVKAQADTLVGTVSGAKSLTGQLTQEAQLVGSLATAYSVGAPNYEGEYEVTPTVAGLSLATRQKYMTDDVKIHAIPFFEVSNQAGGNTIYIAGEIEME